VGRTDGDVQELPGARRADWFAPDPLTGHGAATAVLCDSILDACLAMRLPDRMARIKLSSRFGHEQAWLATIAGDTAVLPLLTKAIL